MSVYLYSNFENRQNLQKFSIKMIKNWSFPEICCFCEERTHTSESICEPCYKTLPWLVDACYYCGRHLETALEHLRCSHCEQSLPSFDRLCALFRYEPPITKLITQLKFNNNFHNAVILGKLFSTQLKEWYKRDSLPEVLIPVPLHLKRLRKRGYNQALEFMRSIEKYTGIPSLPNICERIKIVRPQSTLNKEQRHRNLKGVFKIKKVITHEHIAIVDDVVTTSSTVSALAIALKEAGAKRVDIFAAARA